MRNNFKLFPKKSSGLPQSSGFAPSGFAQHPSRNRAGAQARLIDWIVEIGHNTVRNYWPIGRENLRSKQTDNIGFLEEFERLTVRNKYFLPTSDTVSVSVKSKLMCRFALRKRLLLIRKINIVDYTQALFRQFHSKISKSASWVQEKFM